MMRRPSASIRKDFSLPKPLMSKPQGSSLLRPFDPELTGQREMPPPPSAREAARNEDLLIRLQNYRIRHAVTAKPALWQPMEKGTFVKAATGKLSTMLEYDRTRVATVNLVALRRAIIVDERKRPAGKRPFIPKYVEESKLPPLFSS